MLEGLDKEGKFWIMFWTIVGTAATIVLTSLIVMNNIRWIREDELRVTHPEAFPPPQSNCKCK